ncbi:hypothetical protein FE391_18370 [Nonomuraea sp. KC401]|uniref:hypothetical protein n=1 Tax=unclassified Nonomuraea TaxID=2593643 RepID=UPI0010FE8EEF|nr:MULTISPECIES: hypothetical protein [unclassified Nonomuraea]NBE91959.1 hypothetical protein [Nonomuraea sp. K271]TLF71781.1 hypothetical protein FE391_18370 [Nonomuraea sp. KC401]
MIKRRLAVLAAVAGLAVTGLAGSAMADEPSSFADLTAGTKVICKTSDGKTIEVVRAMPAEGAKPTAPDRATARVERAKPAEVTAPVKPEHRETVEIQAPAKGVKLSEGEARRGVRADADTWKPALPADGIMVRAGEGPHKTVKIECKKAE